MSEDLNKQANELAWSYRMYFDKMIDRGFTPGQITITSIMLSVSQYNIVKGVGAGIAVLTACLNSIMEQDEIDITKIQGYYDKKQEKEINSDIKKEKIKDNIVHLDFKDKD
tara:strand:+ start:7347 stop:7679 length:333 start_codon:yes stop_codon:yes gene_type:complete